MSLRGANFHQAILAKADLAGAHLDESNFCRTDFYETNFEGARLNGANLQGVQLAKTNLTRANLRGCRVFGLSAWDVSLDGAEQRDLEIHYEDLVGGQRIERHATVDGIDVASFMYFTLNNGNIPRIIDATTSQWVLLLGRFGVHKEVLDELAKALKEKNYIPIVFDFEPARQRDLLESIILLAGLSRMVIVDITDPQSTPLELHAIVTNFAVKVVPIMRKGTDPFAVFSGLLKFPWVGFPPNRGGLLLGRGRLVGGQVLVGDGAQHLGAAMPSAVVVELITRATRRCGRGRGRSAGGARALPIPGWRRTPRRRHCRNTIRPCPWTDERLDQSEPG